MRLVAYLVPCDKRTAPTATVLRSFLRERLPEPMMPSAFVVLDQLPLLPGGKVDRRALPDPEDRRPELDTPYVAPQTGMETELRNIWSAVLGISRIGIHDNFLDLGGHSLAAMRVIAEVLKRFQLGLPVQSLFESPTVAKMVAVITEHQAKRIAKPELEQILAELESLSEEKARHFLADATGISAVREVDE